MNTVEKLEALTEKHAEVDWDEDDLATLHAALRDLLTLARATWRLGWNDRGGKCWCPEDHEDERAKFPHTVECVALRKALEPLFREVPS